MENTLFCVPKHGLNVPGTLFAAMFSSPPSARKKEKNGGLDSDLESISGSTSATLDGGSIRSGSKTRAETLAGSGENNPIVLESVSAKGFRHFLRLLYPLCVASFELMVLLMTRFLFDLSPGSGSPPSTYNEWEGVLHLATMWGFGSVSISTRQLRRSICCCLYTVP